jgi:DNA invertase Pin-like site-specific DNA recombinase
MKDVAVAYLRRSTTLQEQSLDRQRHEIESWAAESRVEILRWYEDDGISGTEVDGRAGFQRLIRDAEVKRDFTVVVVAEWSRFARLGIYKTGELIERLRKAGVRVQAIAGSVTDPDSRIGKLLLALEQDREESVKLSMRTLSGQRETALKGLRAGGKVPFGYARRVHRADGKVETIGRIGRGKRDKREVLELVAGEAIEVEAVRSMFAWARDGLGYRSIAGRLNDRGISSPDGAREKTIATVTGRWTATTVRAILTNRAYAGDAVWNVRSMPKFHRLEGGKVVPLLDHDTNHYRRNPAAEWVVKENAHPALVDRETFDAVQRGFRSNASKPRGASQEYLLTGLVACANCGDILIGTRRTRRKVVNGEEKVYADLLYFCAGTLRQKGLCRQVSLPRDAFEREVLKILDEEVFAEANLERLAAALRSEAARRDGSHDENETARLEQRERELAQRVADGARRMLLVDEALIPDVRAALAEVKEQLDRVRSEIEAKRRAARSTAVGDDRVRAVIDSFRSMAAVLHNPAAPLGRRREALRRLLPLRNGERPIRVHVDPTAKRGWRNALRRVTVRHLTTKIDRLRQVSLVAGAVSAEGCHPLPGEDGVLDPGSWLPYDERELLPADLEEAGELVEAGMGRDGWA